MYQRILIPTDGSEGTVHVAIEAIELAKKLGSEIHVLYVAKEEGRTTAAGLTDDGPLSEHGQQAVHRVESIASAHDTDATTEIRSGQPTDTILAYADEVEADLIVAGTHGRSGVERYVLGSVVESLVRQSDIPVLTVKLPETDITVTDEQEAISIARDALVTRGHESISATVADRQQNVWVVEATANGTEQLVYIDPVTQRVSVIHRGDD